MIYIGCRSGARPFSRPLQVVDESQCGFGCSVTYACLPGYLSGIGPLYNTECTSLGVLNPPELCIYGKLRVNPLGYPPPQRYLSAIETTAFRILVKEIYEASL